MRTCVIAGNWKMNKNIREAQNLVEDLWKMTGAVTDREIVVCPPFTALYSISKILENKTIKLGAQDLFWEEKGAYTGEISPLMLKDVGCSYVIIGHSERRGYFAENDESVNKKVKSALNYGLIPIICIGETLAQREAEQTYRVVADQITKALANLTSSQIEKIVVAYEPIWAIGTGKTDSPPEANKVIMHIRDTISSLFGYEVSRKVRILYGGSVKADNMEGFMNQPEIDGALVGGASLKAEEFAKIAATPKFILKNSYDAVTIKGQMA